jgi:hypothetical protein
MSGSRGAGLAKRKKKKPSLLKHEAALVASGELTDITHHGVFSLWLSAPSTEVDPNGELTTVYRHMGDDECSFLLEHHRLPSTQPYQTIVEGAAGRRYCEGYFRGNHRPSGNVVTTIVEFVAPKALIDKLFAMFQKPEDGCLSHGLGDKGGKGLPLFNASLDAKETTFRIVFVKRSV